MTIGRVAAIVVHYRRHDDIGEVLAGLVAQGVSPDALVVVDNSEQPDRLPRLQEVLPLRAHLVVTTNNGYGAAVNCALEHVRELDLVFDYVLVATHEVQMDPGCLERLVGVLDLCDQLSAVGPVLKTSESGQERWWSSGGYISHLSGMPRHRPLPDASEVRDWVGCDWVDGALVLYRLAKLPVDPFCEDFFLYMEEVDLHLRLGRAAVAVVPSAVAWQSSNGMPPYYLARNLRLLARRRYGPLQKLGVAVYLRGLGVRAALRGDRRVRSELRRGRRAPLNTVSAADDVVIVNPLGDALRHYTKQLAKAVDGKPRHVRVLSILEPSRSGKGRLRWVASYVRAVLSWEHRHASLLVTWPVLGYLDLILLAARPGRSLLVVHDPRPLVRSVGYGRASRLVSAKLIGRVEIITHSAAASADLLADLPAARGHTILLPHPVGSFRVQPKGRVQRQVIRVVGQYKRDRDLAVMAAIARQPRLRGVEMEVIGRGWPPVPGWVVRDEFVAEAEFDRLVGEADAIMVPYARFYQSGVALRALERGVPVVGPEGTVIADMCGSHLELLAGPETESWTEALCAALRLGADDVREMYEGYVDNSEASWGRLWEASEE